jgi:hypothetical protein
LSRRAALRRPRRRIPGKITTPFPGPWGQIHSVITPHPFKAGENSIRVVATPGRDASDLDAIAVFPAGQGRPPVAFIH